MYRAVRSFMRIWSLWKVDMYTEVHTNLGEYSPYGQMTGVSGVHICQYTKTKFDLLRIVGPQQY